MFQNYPEGLQCVLAGQKEIEEVMSLYFKTYYAEVSAAIQAKHALNERLDILLFGWLKQLLWEDGSDSFGKKMNLMR